MDEGARFRIAIVKTTSSLIYFRLHERRASNVWHDSSPYGPLVLECENFHELVALLTLGARSAGCELSTLNWEAWDDGLYSTRIKEAEKATARISNNDANEEAHLLQGNSGASPQEEGE